MGGTQDLGGTSELLNYPTSEPPLDFLSLEIISASLSWLCVTSSPKASEEISALSNRVSSLVRPADYL